MNSATLSLLDYDEEIVPEELAELGSFNHSYFQVRLAILFSRLQRYTVLAELSLDTKGLQDPLLRILFKDTLKPDICLYAKRGYFVTEDIVKMEEMPLLAVEILSPMQASQQLIRKMRAYFDLGVQTVWIVYPAPRIVTVYSAPDQFQSFSSGDIIDKTLDINISLAELFH